VRCAICGAVNPEKATACESCGEKIGPSEGPAIEDARQSMTSRLAQAAPMEVIHHLDIARKWKFEYAFGPPDQTSRGLEVISGLMSHIEKPHIDLRGLLNDAATMISKQFGIREVTIGLRDKNDGLFRYVAIVGVRKEAEAALRRLTYTLDDFRPDGRYKGTALGKHSSLFLSEDNPYLVGEENTYSHPVLLGSRRKSLTDSLEGDYIDIMIFGKSDEAVGWIEIAGTRAGKIPDIATIRWMEVISRLIGTAIVCKGYRESRG